jgi:alkane 1-monooxygenase
VDESVWAFALRRAARILREAYGPSAAFWHWRANGRSLRGLRLSTAVTVATAAVLRSTGGPTALLMYLAAAFGVVLGVQVINYIQHWGLGDDRQGTRAREGLGWEDDCRFQAWCTLGISLHQAHHDQSHRPYYLVQLQPDSPRLPAGYIVLMLLALVPPLWRRLMLPALEHWERAPGRPRSPGRRLTCFSAYDQVEDSAIRR